VTARVFIDSNVWVYAVDTGEGAKRARALEVIAPGSDKDYVISAQVLGEFYSVTTGKLAATVPPSQARAMVEQMSLLPVVAIDLPLVTEAIANAERSQMSYWDALIVAAARSAGCEFVLSEDLADGSTYSGVRVSNPFAAEPSDEDDGLGGLAPLRGDRR